MRSDLTLLTLCLVTVPSWGVAQDSAARPEDVSSIDGIVSAFYDVISGPAGRLRQWSRDSTLYVPDVHFVAMDLEDGEPVANLMDHGSYVRRSDPFFIREGFFEREIHRVTRHFGNLAHVFSTYEFRTEDGGIQGRGVNSLHLFWDGERWWIASVMWENERPDNPIPPELLP